MSEITPNTPNPVREDAYVEELSEKLGIDPQYIPKSPVWRNEEEIKAIAEMFANMSGSSGGGVLAVHDVDGTLDKTWQEIHDALESSLVVVISNSTDTNLVTGVIYDSEQEDPYWVYSLAPYSCSNTNDYPSTGEK